MYCHIALLGNLFVLCVWILLPSMPLNLFVPVLAGEPHSRRTSPFPSVTSLFLHRCLTVSFPCFSPPPPQVASLGELVVTGVLGAGGFARVFKGLWRGLVVAVKVVVDDGTNSKAVMRNAHEIAILGALSHPNIVQVCGRDSSM